MSPAEMRVLAMATMAKALMGHGIIYDALSEKFYRGTDKFDIGPSVRKALEVVPASAELDEDDARSGIVLAMLARQAGAGA